jgi:hypothetical protein
MDKFKGIKYSRVTKIFYKFVKDQLYRYSTTATTPIWVKSDFKDYNNRSQYWVNITEKQKEKFFPKILKKGKKK